MCSFIYLFIFHYKRVSLEFRNKRDILRFLFEFLPGGAQTCPSGLHCTLPRTRHWPPGGVLMGQQSEGCCQSAQFVCRAHRVTPADPVLRGSGRWQTGSSSCAPPSAFPAQVHQPTGVRAVDPTEMKTSFLWLLLVSAAVKPDLVICWST